MVSLQDVSTFIVPGQLCALPQNEVDSCTVSEYYPEINLNCEMFSTSVSGHSNDTYRNVMIPVNEGVIKRIVRTFFESGFMEALNEARDQQTATVSPLICATAKYTCEMLDFVKRLKTKIFPHMREVSVNNVAEYSETRDWLRSYIRCIVWHPNCFKIAVAGSDDIVRIYTDEPAMVPVLKSGSQKWITSMAWRPLTAAELAVGCQKGVCLWTMDTNMHITRSATQAVFLKHPGHCPITSLQWSPSGTLLATASISDTDILIWDVDKLQNTPVRRVGSPCSLLKWSPDGAYLFSATVGSVFRVWSADKKWTPERWTIKCGVVQSACWSPCGNFLLFVTTGDSILYRLHFQDETVFASGTSTKEALKIADLTKFNAGRREVGGKPQALAWDADGRYLAVIFKDTPCIALFNTCLKKFDMTISPLCFLTGLSTEYPSYICFQSKNRRNTETVLTIGWSSGRIEYFPFGNM
ncbi:aladin [Zeugodacus cucurbitae]|uniref:aladin n=1 Tax=Zeugodacus cucurbitae TaxID=28588 RepID=UPI00059692C7|nr:aladin [Zeugodacus cucurbitae]